MIPIQPYYGKLKCQRGDRGARDSHYLEVTVPRDYVEMKSLGGFEQKTPLSYNDYYPIQYGFALYLEKRFVAMFGDSAPLMDIEMSGDAAVIRSTGAVAEWLVEQQGYLITSRFSDTLQSHVDDILEIDPDVAIVNHTRHVAVKMKSIETQMLLEIRFGEYRSKTNSRSTLAEVATV